MNSRAGSPGLSVQTSTNSNGKRRADDTDGGVTGGAPSPEATSPGGTSINGRVPKKARIGGKSAPTGRLTEEMIVEWIMSTENPTSKECINRFRPYIKEEGAKNEFTAMIKKLVTLKEGRMVLKPIYAGGRGTSPSTPVA
jgi:transcription initiation factor TFIIF subunit alpha